MPDGTRDESEPDADNIPAEVGGGESSERAVRVVPRSHEAIGGSGVKCQRCRRARQHEYCRRRWGGSKDTAWDVVSVGVNAPSVGSMAEFPEKGEYCRSFAGARNGLIAGNHQNGGLRYSDRTRKMSARHPIGSRLWSALRSIDARPLRIVMSHQKKVSVDSHGHHGRRGGRSQGREHIQRSCVEDQQLVHVLPQHVNAGCAQHREGCRSGRRADRQWCRAGWDRGC